MSKEHLSNRLPEETQCPEEFVEISALDVICGCARESFTPEQLRYLAHRFDEMAAAKEAGR